MLQRFASGVVRKFGDLATLIDLEAEANGLLQGFFFVPDSRVNDAWFCDLEQQGVEHVQTAPGSINVRIALQEFLSSPQAPDAQGTPVPEEPEPEPSGAPVVGSVSSSYTVGQGNPLTFSATVAAGEKLLVFVRHYDHFLDVSSVTFNGAALTRLDKGSAQNYLYYLDTPDVGTHSVVVTLSSSRWQMAAAIPVSNWNGALRAISGSISVNGLLAQSAGASVSLTSAVDDLAIGMIVADFAESAGNWTATPGAGQTSLFTQLPHTGTSVAGAGSSKPGASSSVTLSNSVSGSVFSTSMTAFSLKN